ncbi:MAG: AMP-binding protein [Desulfotalea sp.]
MSAASFFELPKWEQKIFQFLNLWWGEEEYIIQKTSGSTGTPKPIKLPKKAMLSSAKRTCAYFSLQEQSSLGLCLSTDYIAGKMMLVRAIVSGANLQTVVPDGNGVLGFSDELDFIAMVPLQAAKILAETSCKFHAKQILLGGSDVGSALREKIAENCDTSFYIGYGMTETCSHIALCLLDGDTEVYEAMDGVNIAQDDRNCLLIDDKILGIGPLITNDIVNIKGNCFSWLGRWDNVINSGGIKFSPEDIEQKISHLIDIPFIISSISDEVLGNRLILVVEGVEAEHLNKKTIAKQVSTILTKYEIPKNIVFVASLVKTESGKVNRLASYEQAVLRSY